MGYREGVDNRGNRASRRNGATEGVGNKEEWGITVELGKQRE